MRAGTLRRSLSLALEERKGHPGLGKKTPRKNLQTAPEEHISMRWEKQPQRHTPRGNEICSVTTTTTVNRSIAERRNKVAVGIKKSINKRYKTDRRRCRGSCGSIHFVEAMAYGIYMQH